MAAGLSTAVTFKPLHRAFSSSYSSSNFRLHHPKSLTGFPSSILRFRGLSVCYVIEERRQSSPIDNDESTSYPETTNAIDAEYLALRLAEKLERKKSERFTYLIAAVMSSFGITSMAIMSVYYRFAWQMEGSEIPLSEMFGTFALSVGAAVGMEFWARWAHKALWHASLWNMHESHHKPREGPFELNDVFAIVNAVPAIGLLSYGFFNKGLVPGLCFGAVSTLISLLLRFVRSSLERKSRRLNTNQLPKSLTFESMGLGITVFGIAYMFVHDGLVHKRFPVGPIADVPYLRKVAAAHQLHHTDKFDGVPYGLFLGPKELEEVGGGEELEKEISRRIKLYKKGSSSS